jgi:hypothetical protein
MTLPQFWSPPEANAFADAVLCWMRKGRERDFSSPFRKKWIRVKRKKNARENEEMRRYIEHARGVVTELVVHFRRSSFVCLRELVRACVLMARVLFNFVCILTFFVCF